MPPVKSKGKWLPGAGPGDVLKKPRDYYPLFCEPCNRGFVKGVSYERHLSTELHFSRQSKKILINSYEKDPDFFEKVNTSFPRPKRTCNAFKEALTPEINSDKSILTCPTCFSNVDKAQIGKHLISHFHWQAASSQSSYSAESMNFILTYIHEVVRQSPFQCYDCKYYFLKKEQLIEHFSKIHLIDPPVSELVQQDLSTGSGWTCSSCFETSTLDKELMFKHLSSDLHQKMERAIEKSIPIVIRKIQLFHCKYCNKKFRFRRHLYSHKNNSRVCKGSYNQVESEANIREKACTSLFNCTICSYSSQKKGHYDRHLKTHNTSREKPFKCDVCHSCFFEKYALKYHQQTHYGKQIKCDIPGCEFVGRCKSDLEAHKKVHEQGREFQCGKCTFSSKTKYNLKRHQILVHAEPELGKIKQGNFSCVHCSFTTKLKQALLRHLRTHEIPNKLYHCPQCDYKSGDLELLRKHFTGTIQHKGDNLYKCQLCRDENLTNSISFDLFSKFKSHILKNHHIPNNLILSTSSSTDEYLAYAVGLLNKNKG